MPLALPDLPYAYSALEPFISSETLHIHHDKHHAAYVQTANNLIKTTHFESAALDDIVIGSRGEPSRALFNAAAQVWNHTFYWSSMMPGGGGQPHGKLAEKIVADFGNVETFNHHFMAAALAQFGSGWVWLILDGGRLKVRQTANAETPLTSGETPLLTCDVWEHAYYIDYRNERRNYAAAFLASLANWEFANRNFEAAVGAPNGGKSAAISFTPAEQGAR